MNGIITKGGNLQGAVPPSEAAGNDFQMQMILDALDYHENGDDADGPCCTGDAPCQTRIFLVGQQRKLAGAVLGAREEARAEAVVETRTQISGGSSQTGGGKVLDPASDKQIQYIKGLNEQHDCDKIGTFPRRTLDAILADQEVSKSRASRLIEVMKRQPKKTPDPIERTPAAGPAPSDAQLGFLRTLAEENGEDLPAVRTKQEASDEITRLIQAREDRKKSGSAPVQTGSAVTEDGLYRTPDGEIYKVQVAVHGSGRLYAKKLTKLDEPRELKKGTRTHEFVRAPGALRKLTPAMKLTMEQMKALGSDPQSELYGTCCKCGMTLTDETSIAEGLGPICGGRRK